MKPLRLWPGVTAVVLLVLVKVGLPFFAPDGVINGMPAGVVSMLGAVALAAVILLWWVLFSRAPWSERLGAIAVMAASLAAIQFVVDESIWGGGQLYPMLVTPGMSVALVAWAVASRGLSIRARQASMVAILVLACASWALVRTGGISGDGEFDFHWRWTPTTEERLLARERGEPVAPAPAAAAPAPAPTVAPSAEKQPANGSANIAPAAATAARAPGTSVADEGEDPLPAVARRAAEWPGFRGPNRDSAIRGVRINTDWNAAPPVEIWRKPIGPGWSSFAVDGDLLFTQEQRGDHEVVAAYKVSTGEPVWTHRDAARFYEPGAGAGPRATPTVHNGRVYSHGAMGTVNALDSRTGAVLWSRNTATDTSVEIPGWGFASSPLVIDDLVVIAASGRLVGYDARTGKPRWLGPEGGLGYSSPHLFTIDGVPQIVLLRGGRTISVGPADGKLLWDHTWQPGAGFLQPVLTPDGDVLISTGNASGFGIRRVAVAKESSGWKVEERWTSRGLKPYFNDLVVHEGHAYGFDGSILSCIDLANGERRWKGGRYGHGQMLLLAGQDLLLVLSEEGDLVLVKATPDQFTEVARVKAIEGKTWNHPALVGHVLFVRNGAEMAAFRLPSAADATQTSRRNH